MNEKHRYSINFDMHTDKESLKELGEKVGISKSKMYDIIKDHLKENGFEWVQGSGLITKDFISSRKLTDIVISLFEKNIWLGHFTRDIKRTIVDNKTYSYDSMLHHYDEEYKKEYYKDDKNPYKEAYEKTMNDDEKDDLKERAKALVDGLMKNKNTDNKENRYGKKGKDKGNENDGR